jgi:hypothetical protein
MKEVFVNKNYDPLTGVIEKAIKMGLEKAIKKKGFTST